MMIRLEPDPWELPKLPIYGDFDAEATYQGVGWVLSAWEHVEQELSRSYSFLIGRPEDVNGYREYGLGDTFKRRIRELEKRAISSFLRRPDQRIEGEMDKFICCSRKFSIRRNEVAHGIVLPLRYIRWFRDQHGSDPDWSSRLHTALLPPVYSLKKFDARNRPDYAYTHDSLAAITRGLFKLSHDLEVFNDSLTS